MFKFKPFFDLALSLWSITVTVYDWFFTPIYLPEFEILGNTYGGVDIVPIYIICGSGIIIFLVFTLVKYFVK